MTDGPHRTLPMRSAWKGFAYRADNQSYSAEEVAELVCPALASDWQSEVRPSLLHSATLILEESAQQGLFGNEVHEINCLRSSCDSPLAAAFCDAVKNVLIDGLRGPDAVEQAIRTSLVDRALCQIRAVEEHYMRRSDRVRASSVRLRLEEAVNCTSFDALVKAISSGLSIIRRFEPKVRDDLDDGVQLCAR